LGRAGFILEYMLGRAVLLLGLGSLAAAEEDPTDVLIRLRDQVLAHAQQIPNHTCVELVRRDQYEAVAGPPARSCETLLARRKLAGVSSKLRLVATDRLRLDVLLASDRELYSWAGAEKFEERDIDELVTQGAFGTGPFASMLLSVLQSSDARFLFEGDTSVASRRLFEYSFNVPLARSRYRVKAQKDWVFTGYTGSIFADPVSAELVRFTVHTEELPAETGSCEDESELEYSSVRLGGDDYLLPKIARQRFIMRDGSEGENTITFSACRDFRGESTVNFSRDVAGSKSLSAGQASLEIPAGLPVTVELTSPPVRSDQAAAGDRIEGRLVNPIRDPIQQTIRVPAGARMIGRLMRVETQWRPSAQVTFALRWETVEVDGTATPIRLNPNHRVQVQPATQGGLQRRGVEIQLPLPGEERYYITQIEGEQGVLDTGSRSEWITARP
jgi:hypothetical protein